MGITNTFRSEFEVYRGTSYGISDILDKQFKNIYDTLGANDRIVSSVPVIQQILASQFADDDNTWLVGMAITLEQG